MKNGKNTVFIDNTAKTLVIPIDQTQVLEAVQKTGDDYKLSEKLGGNTAELKKQVKSELQRGLATQLSYEDIARNISNYGEADMKRSMRIARTEGHRVQSDARLNAMYTAKEKGVDVVKQWDSTLDGKTRDTHRELDGQIRELDEPFEIAGMKAQSPGNFGIAAEDCNCRCCVLQKVRQDAENETSRQRWNNETGGIIETTGYKDFEEKYLKSVEKLKESGIINTGGISGAKKTEGWEDRHAKLMYEEIRNRKTDVKNISENTQFSEKAISSIKDHLFSEKHLFADGTIRSFDPDFEQAQAWDRLSQGKGTETDILLLKHEFVELTQMRIHGYDYETAHAIANQKYNWWKAIHKER